MAERFGVDCSTVNRVKGAGAEVAAPAPPVVTGQDGKTYPSTKPTPEQLEERVERVAEAKAEGKTVAEIAQDGHSRYRAAGNACGGHPQILSKPG